MQDIGHRFAQSSMTVRPITATVDPPGHQQGHQQGLAMPNFPLITAAMRTLALALAARRWFGDKAPRSVHGPGRGPVIAADQHRGDEIMPGIALVLREQAAADAQPGFICG